MNFTTKIESEHVWLNAQYKDLDVDNIQCTIKWHVNLDVREYGIKDINVYVDSVKLEYDLLDSESFNHVRSVGETYEEIEVEVKGHAHLMPQRVEIDIQTKKVEVVF